MNHPLLRILPCAMAALGMSVLPVQAAAEFAPVKLPDGTEFKTWEKPLEFTKTYHVWQIHGGASDRNVGDEIRPWKTIGKAAEMLQPGERVIIHGGVYREWVAPARGGSSPKKMISYEAAPGEKVVITGADVWAPEWVRTRYFTPFANGVATWEARLDARMFTDANVFCLQYFPQQKPILNAFSAYMPTFELRRGQLWLDGKQLTQVGLYTDLAEAPGRFWVEDNGMTIHMRMPDNSNPNGRNFEIVTREQVFAPKERFLNFIRVKGLHLLQAANGIPIPPPQKGLLSSFGGHHWIIEDCEVGYANTIGIDLGSGWWGTNSYTPGEMQGYHIVRGNHVHDCGISGLGAWHAMDNEQFLVEDNIFINAAFLPVTAHWESGAVKLHQLTNSIIRRNVILDTPCSAGIWVDGMNSNVRITQNLVVNSPSGNDTGGTGGIYIEISPGVNMVDNNAVVGSSFNGFYTHNSQRILLAQNLFAGAADFAIRLNPHIPDVSTWENEHRVFGNILADSKSYIRFTNETSYSDYNLLGGVTPENETPFIYSANWEGADGKRTLQDWRKLNYETHSVELPMKVKFNPETMELSVKAAGKNPKLPAFDVAPEPVQGFAPLAELLTADLLGKKRDPGVFVVGPLLNLPLDGTPVKVDPRAKNSSR